jgi:hypothetical protein
MLNPRPVHVTGGTRALASSYTELILLTWSSIFGCQHSVRLFL